MRRSGEARDDRIGQEWCELVISHVAAEPSRDCVDLVELAGRDRISETSRRRSERGKPEVARRRRRRAEGLERRRDRGDLRPRLAALAGCDAGEQGCAGRELEGCVKHERVGGIGARVAHHRGDGRDELGVGEVVDRHGMKVQVEVNFKSRASIRRWTTIP